MMTDQGTRNDRQNMAQHAVAYARAGLQVLPLHWPTPAGCSCREPKCTSVGKHPLTKHGKDDATSDVKKTGTYWTIYPEANIGIRPPDGVAVLDVDPRAGGAVRLAELLAACGVALPATLTANTGGGGIHAWYRCPAPTAVACAKASTSRRAAATWSRRRPGTPRGAPTPGPRTWRSRPPRAGSGS